MMISYNKKIMREQDFKDALSNKKSGKIDELPRWIYDIFASLQDKELIYWDAGWGNLQVTVRDSVWKLIKRRYKKDFNMGNKEKK